MNAADRDVFVHLLIDNGMLHGLSTCYSEVDSQSRPSWLAPIYADHALAVSPFLVDVEAAYEAGDIDRVMGFLNARRPGLHVSIIETGLDLEQIARHLRRFIFILDPHGRQFTLRYADCAVLAPLSSLLTAAQWATMKGPITRWGIHDRSGAVVQLLPAEPNATAPTPFCLDHDQLTALDEVSEPDHYVAKVGMMRNGAALPGNTEKRHAWAHAARQAWRAAANPNPLVLLFLTEAALFTQGEILRRPEVQALLKMDEVSAFRNKLRELAKDMRERRRWASPAGTAAGESDADILF
jgi:hypothetical protein